MATMKVEFYVHKAWWLPIYLHGVALVATLMQAEPDWEKVQRMVARAITIKAR
jgi:hypothetical protein